MNISRNNSRKKAMTVLYQISLYQKNKIDYDLDILLQDSRISSNTFAKQLINGVTETIQQLDTLANKYLNNWNISRLGLTDQAIIRIAIYELLYTSTPGKICLDEAIELAKEYSDEKVVKMINGTLDKIYHNEISRDHNER